mmetsp:Transcript_10370/g.20331  ORF Transcript_10370/g.20331 Transcript_10370/m.20331 type:complete len:233 (+) Transcript_10370:169-867(+)
MNTTLRTSSAAAKRTSTTLLSSWLATPATVAKGPSRVASRESHSLVAGWAYEASARPVGPRAASREAHSLLSAWASEASSATKNVPPRAVAREGKSLLHAWLVGDGVAKQTPKEAIKRGPVPSAGLAYRWLMSDGVSRIGSEEVILASASRGMFPVTKHALVATWLGAEGSARMFSDSVGRMLRLSLGLAAGVVVATGLAQAREASAHAQARKLMRRGSLASARLSRRLSLR